MLTENKFNKYILYAIGEILLVSIGILIAFQVNNWKNERSDNKKEHTILNQLKSDFESNDKLIKSGIERYQINLDRQILTIKNTGPNTVMPEKSDLQKMYRINSVSVSLVFGDKNSNMSNDYINILENSELKKNISSFPSKLISYADNEKLNKDIASKQRELYAKYFSLASNDQSLSEHLNSVYPSKIIDWLTDRENQNNATMGYWIIKNFCIPKLSHIRIENQIILDMIDSELYRFR